MKPILLMLLLGTLPLLEGADENYTFVNPDTDDLAAVMGFNVFEKIQFTVPDAKAFEPCIVSVTQRDEKSEETIRETALHYSPHDQGTAPQYLLVTVLDGTLKTKINGQINSYPPDYFQIDPNSGYISKSQPPRVTKHGLFLFSGGTKSGEKISFYFKNKKPI